MKKISSLVLAALLQMLPVCRMAYTFCALPSCDYAVISAWGLGAAALFGGVDAISGQSIKINSSTAATGTVGQPFSYRITTTATFEDMRYTAAPVPTGTTALGNSFSPVISGTPTAPGVFHTTLTVSATEYPTITQPLTITIVEPGPPTIVTQPTNQYVLAGKNAGFTVVVAGASSYQWWFGAAKAAFGTNATLAITNAQAANIGNYFVVASNSLGTATSSIVSLTIGLPPAINTQPLSQVSEQGSNVTFSVAASGAGTLAYQWNFNGAAISGAAADSYTEPDVAGTNAGNYTVVVGNAFGSVTSSIATLTVAGGIQLNNHVAGSLVSPLYAAQPSNAFTALYGNTATGIPRGTVAYTGALLASTNYTAQLWAAIGANQPESALTLVPNATTTFGTGANAGFLVPVSPVPVIPGAVEGDTATLELRVWDNQAGTITNWTQVRATRTIRRATSALINSQPLGGVIAAPALAGMLSFNIHVSSGTSLAQNFSAGIQGKQLSLTFPAIAGQNYSVQYTGSLEPGTNSWLTLTNLMAVATNTTCFDSLTNAARRFYRIGWLSN